MKNFEKTFGFRLPSLDAVADVIKEMPEEQLEDLKIQMIKILLENKFFISGNLKVNFLLPQMAQE